MRIGAHGESLHITAVKKILVYGIILFILTIAQCSFFSSLTFLSATPRIVIGAVAAVALFETRQTATVFALSAGFMLDALGGSGITVSALVMLLFSVILSSLASKILKSFFPWMLLLAIASLLSAAETYLRILIAGSANDITFVIGKILLPELLYTFLFSLPLYFIFGLAAKFCKSKGKFKI